MVKVLAFGMLLAASAYGAPSDWWNDAWTCRKLVQVAPVGDVNVKPAAAVAFSTCGLLQRKASDLRVIAQDGSEVPYSVIAAGFEDLCTVAFPVSPGQEWFYLYFGNPNAPEAKYDWQPQRGLTLEVRTKGEGGFGNWNQMEDLIRKSPTVQGRGLHPAVFDGHNRFGPSDNYISIYKGYLYAPVDGSYDFATTSDDASFLFLDSQSVVEWPGGHVAVADARYNAKVQLTAGVHFLEYFHVEADGDQVAEAAWRLPGEKDFHVIPPEAFLPFWYGGVVAYEQRDDPAPLDFGFWQESSLVVSDGLMSAMAFRVSFPAAAAHQDQQWDFGDGVTAATRNPTHVYAKPGEYQVRLTVSGKSVAQTVRAWHNEVLGEASAEDKARAYANALAAYDLAKMSEDALLVIGRFAADTGAARLEQGAFAALRGNAGSYGSVPAGRRLLDYAEAYRVAGQTDEALKLYGDLASRHAGSEIISEALHQKGQLLLSLDRGDEAFAAFQELDSVSGHDATYRSVALSDLGDYYRHAGDAAKARECYTKAQQTSSGPTGVASIARGGYSQAALEYLRANDADAALDSITKWERAFPLDKLDGYLSVLKAVALVKRGDAGLAYAEARDALAANPHGNYAPHAMMVMGDCLSFLGRLEEARATYLKLIEQYPESPLQKEARQRAENPPRTIEGALFPIVSF